MEFLTSVLDALSGKMETPTMLSGFHIFWWIITIAGAIVLSLWHRKHMTTNKARTVLLVTTVIVIVLEIYKQLLYTYQNGWNYQWYAFPMQFCSTPMYVGLLAGLTKKGKIHKAACAYMATFSLFAGTAVMVYPGDVFVDTIGINIQTMICHGSMIFLGIYLMATNYVKPGIKTVLWALPVFTFFLLLAMGLNEWAYRADMLGEHYFNMFYISPHLEGHLPLYSNVQAVVAYPWNLLIYIIGFAAAAYVMQLLAILIRQIGRLFNFIFRRKKASV